MPLSSTRLLAGALAVLVPLAAQAGEVDHREGRQQGRIGQGLASGQITAGGAGQLEHREADINRSREHDLAAHGGHLTTGEDRNLDRRRTSLSGSIDRDKHNDIAQPGVVPQ